MQNSYKCPFVSPCTNTSLVRLAQYGDYTHFAISLPPPPKVLCFFTENGVRGPMLISQLSFAFGVELKLC